MTSTTVNTNKGTIEFTSFGKGIPILFIHGGHVNCNFTLPHKGIDQNKFQLITPSRPGYGKTKLINNGSPYQTAELFVSLLDYLKIEKVILYGISAGGWTALQLAANFPERVSGLILGSAVTMDWLDKNGNLYKGAKVIFSPKLEWLTWGMVKLISIFAPKFIAHNFLPSFSKKTSTLPHDEISEFVAALKIFRSKKGFINDIEQTVPVDILPKISCPTLILHSENDNSVPVIHAHHANEKIENSELYLINNTWGHMIWIGKEYQSVQEKILDFINDENIR